jgi:hypothetical protein
MRGSQVQASKTFSQNRPATWQKRDALLHLIVLTAEPANRRGSSTILKALPSRAQLAQIEDLNMQLSATVKHSSSVLHKEARRAGQYCSPDRTSSMRDFNRRIHIHIVQHITALGQPLNRLYSAGRKG